MSQFSPFPPAFHLCCCQQLSWSHCKPAQTLNWQEKCCFSAGLGFWITWCTAGQMPVPAQRTCWGCASSLPKQPLAPSLPHPEEAHQKLQQQKNILKGQLQTSQNQESTSELLVTVLKQVTSSNRGQKGWQIINLESEQNLSPNFLKVLNACNHQSCIFWPEQLPPPVLTPP